VNIRNSLTKYSFVYICTPPAKKAQQRGLSVYLFYFRVNRARRHVSTARRNATPNQCIKVQIKHEYHSFHLLLSTKSYGKIIPSTKSIVNKILIQKTGILWQLMHCACGNPMAVVPPVYSHKITP